MQNNINYFDIVLFSLPIRDSRIKERSIVEKKTNNLIFSFDIDGIVGRGRYFQTKDMTY